MRPGTGNDVWWCGWRARERAICRILTLGNGGVGQENPNQEKNMRRTGNILGQSLGIQGCYLTPVRL